MDNIFQGIFPGELDTSGEATKTAQFTWQGKKVECDIINWRAPDGRYFTIALVLLCPNCRHPLIVKAVDGAYGIGESGELTINLLLKCPGHWHAKNERGEIVPGPNGAPRIVQCAWTGIILHGVAHHPNCNCLRYQGNVQYCNCGAVTRQ